MKNKILRSGIITCTLVMLLGGLFSPVMAAPPPDYANSLAGQQLTGGVSAKLNSIVYQGLQNAFADINLQGYKVTATTKVTGNKGQIYTCDTVADLSNKTCYQTQVVRIVAEYDLGGTSSEPVKVLSKQANYMDAQEAMDYGGAAGAYTASTAHAVLFAPEPADPTSQTAADAIQGYFTAKGKTVDKYKAAAATEAKAWAYVKNGSSVLCAWWHLAHGLTANADGAACYGYKFNGASDYLYYTEFRGLRQWNGLKGTVCYMNGCNTWWGPIQNAVVRGNHQVRTYVGGKKLMPFAGTGATDANFWKFAVQDEIAMGTALTNAQTAQGWTNYYGLWGDAAQYFRILLLQDDAPWTLSNETLLDSNKIPYLTKGSSVFATENFAKYDVVIIAGDQKQLFYDRLGASMARINTYCNAGGTLEFHCCPHGWNNGNISYALPGGINIVDRYDGTNAVANTDHRLTKDVANPFSGTYASHGYFTGTPPGAYHVICTTTDLYPTLMEYQMNKGTVIISSQPLEYGYKNSQAAGTILRNMISEDCEDAYAVIPPAQDGPAVTPARSSAGK